MDLMREILAGEKVTANHPPRQAGGTLIAFFLQFVVVYP